MIDSHCHLNDLLYKKEEVGGLIKEAKERGVTTMICNGAGVESSKKAIALSEKYAEVWATVGIHPEEGKVPGGLSDLVKHRKVVAIGECGLDYREETTEEDKKWQRKLFEFNIKLAKENNLPVVVHCRNAYEEVYEQVRHLGLIGQMHCFTGNYDWMRKFVDLGWYISFGGILTFKRSGELREVARQTPQERILVETDAPYLAPEPVRGSQNEPKNVMIIAAALASIRGQTGEEIDRFTTENAKRLFRIIQHDQTSTEIT